MKETFHVYSNVFGLFIQKCDKNKTGQRKNSDPWPIFIELQAFFFWKKILTSNSGFCNYYYFLMSINTFPVKAAYMLFCNICKRLNLIVIQYLYLHPQLTVSLDINLKLSFDKINIFLNLLVHVVSL